MHGYRCGKGDSDELSAKQRKLWDHNGRIEAQIEKHITAFVRSIRRTTIGGLTPYWGHHLSPHPDGTEEPCFALASVYLAAEVDHVFAEIGRLFGTGGMNDPAFLLGQIQAQLAHAAQVDDAVARLTAEVADLKDRDRVISRQLELRSMGKDELTRALTAERDALQWRNTRVELARLGEAADLTASENDTLLARAERAEEAVEDAKGDAQDLFEQLKAAEAEAQRLREERDLNALAEVASLRATLAEKEARMTQIADAIDESMRRAMLHPDVGTAAFMIAMPMAVQQLRATSRASSADTETKA